MTDRNGIKFAFVCLIFFFVILHPVFSVLMFRGHVVFVLLPIARNNVLLQLYTFLWVSVLLTIAWLVVCRRVVVYILLSEYFIKISPENTFIYIFYSMVSRKNTVSFAMPWIESRACLPRQVPSCYCVMIVILAGNQSILLYHQFARSFWESDERKPQMETKGHKFIFGRQMWKTTKV